MKIRFSSQPGRHIDDEIGTKVIVTKHAGKIAAAIFMGVFAIVSGVGWLIWTTSGASAALMAQGAVEVVAQVEGLEVERNRSTNSNNNRTTTSYYADVSFADQEGTRRQVRTSISEADYYSLQTGQDLPLRYAVEDPSVVELHEGDLASTATVGYWVMVGGLCGLGLTVVVALFRSRRKPNVI
jgi:Protein of unknown function (DUF3592)